MIESGLKVICNESKIVVEERKNIPMDRRGRSRKIVCRTAKQDSDSRKALLHIFFTIVADSPNRKMLLLLLLLCMTCLFNLMME
jgi:hypothetical protein